MHCRNMGWSVTNWIAWLRLGASRGEEMCCENEFHEVLGKSWVAEWVLTFQRGFGSMYGVVHFLLPWKWALSVAIMGLKANVVRITFRIIYLYFPHTIVGPETIALFSNSHFIRLCLVCASSCFLRVWLWKFGLDVQEISRGKSNKQKKEQGNF